MATQDNFISENLSIYIDYDFLTVQQYSAILTAINNVFNDVVRISIYHERDNIDIYDYYYYRRYLDLPLCVQTINTGGSINFKVSLERKFFPGLEIENGDTLKILLPKWTAALIVTAAILGYGMDKYQQYLDIRNKELDNELKERELANKINEEVNHQLKFIDVAKNNNSSLYFDLNQNYNSFQSEIYNRNIYKVEVNEVVVK